MDHPVPITGIKFKETRQEVGRSLVKLSPCGDKQQKLDAMYTLNLLQKRFLDDRMWDKEKREQTRMN